MTSAKKLISATLNVPGDFISARELVREPVDSVEVGVNPQAFPESEEKALKVEGSDELEAANSSNELVPIRALTTRHRKRILRHMLELSERDRYLRFGYQARDEHIEKYVENLDFARDEVFGVFNRRLQLVAVAHLAFSTDPQNTQCAEFGVSVSSHARGKGVGTRLFGRAVVNARSQGVRMLFIHALSENEAMLKIARKAGAVVESYGGEVQAHLRLPQEALGQMIESVVRDAVEDGLGEVDFQLKLSALQFWKFLTSVQEMRQGMRAIEGETET